MRAMNFAGQLLQDIRYAARVVARQPGTTFIIVLSLALGIGANTVIFTLVNAILLRQLPYPEPDRLVELRFTPPNRPDQLGRANATICMDLPGRVAFFTAAGCYIGVSGNVADPADALTTGPEWLEGEMLTYPATQAIGVKPILGRWFTAAEDHGDAEKVMLISYDLWQRRFKGSPDILGKRLRVADFGGNDSPSTIIGVMPPGFSYANTDTDYFVPLRATGRGRRSPARNRDVVARLKDGWTLDQAQESADQLARAFGEESEANRGWGIRVVPLDEWRVGPNVRSAVLILQGTAAIVLLIACANVGGLLIAQGATRQRELAVRAAIGSGRWRIIRQLLTESLVLSALGAIACLAIVGFGMSALLKWLPQGLPRLSEVSINPGVLLFTAGVSLVTAIIFGILPALHASRPNLTTAFKAGDRAATASPGRLRLRSAFVVLQISAALVLLTSSGLLINSLIRLTNVDPGFDPRNLTTFQMAFTGRGFFGATGNVTPIGSLEMELSPRIGTVVNDIRDRLAALPGVEAVTTQRYSGPLQGWNFFPFTIAGRTPPSDRDGQGAGWLPIGADYFKVLGVPVLRGREFTDLDTLSGQPVVLVNEAMAKRFWPTEDPIGQRIAVQFYNDQPRQIVGIVPDIRPSLRNREPVPVMYVPHTQLPAIQAGITAFGLENVAFVVRSRREISDWLPGARAAAKELDPAHAVNNVQLVSAFTRQQTQGFRQYVILLGAFSAIALLLAVVGIYGVMSHSVTQRTPEIGIRVAFGATARDVLGSVLGRGLAVIGAGMAIGLAVSLGLTRTTQIISSTLWGVTATDPATYAIVLVTLFAVACLACYVPARRALKVDPLVAMRHD
jgi:putative ABC transport system permease protein